MDAQAAARLGDEIAHGFGVAAMLAGAVAGALIGAAVIAATVATGGLAVVIMAGAIAAGGLSMFQIVKGLGTIFSLPEPTTGKLSLGSLNVYINGLNAMRAGEDIATSCTGLPMNHPLWPFPVLIAEGSATVFINGKPAARLHSKMVCGAHIKSGSPDTFIGGPTVSVAFVLDIEGWLHTGLETLGLLAAGGALILAGMVGLAVLTEFVVIGGMVLVGMAILGDLGDRLGPGYRDLLQGVAGMALLGLGAKLAKPKATPVLEAEPRTPLPKTLEEIPAKAPDAKGPGALANAERGTLTEANFAQNRIKADRSFSEDGQRVYSELAGTPIKTVDDLAGALRTGSVKPGQLPVDYVDMNGTRLILNTRTSTALEQAGIPRSEWYGRNQTGVEAYPGKTFNDLAADQLKNNKLPPTGAEKLKSVRP